MSLTLDNIELPDDLIWLDEFDWSPVEQLQTYTLTGSIVFESALKHGGRTIMIGEGSSRVHTTRAVVDALYAKLSINAEMTLTLQDSREFTVRFHHENKPIDAKPVFDYRIKNPADPYHLTFRLITTS